MKGDATSPTRSTLTPAELLAPLVARRAREVVVSTMSVVRPWGMLSSSSLDFASADSAMGHAADLALGIAMARPARRVLCLNGDGSMLMSLGTLATAVQAEATNLVILVVNNGGYEITGSQPVAGAGTVDFAALAVAAGFPVAFTVDNVQDYERILDPVFHAPGPVLVDARIEPGSQGPIGRSSAEQALYLQTSLFDWARTLRHALADDLD